MYFFLSELNRITDTTFPTSDACFGSQTKIPVAMVLPPEHCLCDGSLSVLEEGHGHLSTSTSMSEPNRLLCTVQHNHCTISVSLSVM